MLRIADASPTVVRLLAMSNDATCGLELNQAAPGLARLPHKSKLISRASARLNDTRFHGRKIDRDLLNDFNAEAFERGYPLGTIGQQADASKVEI